MDIGAIEPEILEKKLQLPTAPLPLEFLDQITHGFSTQQEVGRGAYGVVYKGVLRSGKAIAVKKIFDEHLLDWDHNTNYMQLKNEILRLMEVRHQNVVRLVGYCVQAGPKVKQLTTGEYVVQPVCLLCYKFHPNGSLDKYLSDDFSVLDWDTRYEIIRGVCRGLHYLHDECHSVHLDLKPQNILMDTAMMPKIADFGLSRLFHEQGSILVTRKLPGTLGYMAKEYIDHGIISYKADIFSLGVIIIEIITGHRDYPNIGERTETSLKHYTDEVVESWKNRLLKITLIHMSLEMHIQQVEQCISLALKCLEPDSKKRPTSLEIVQSLNAVEPKCRSPGKPRSVAEKDIPVTALIDTAMESPVTASLGPMAPLLRKVSSLKFMVPKHFKEHLEVLCRDLLEPEETSSMPKWWRKEVRELLYDTEDRLDKVILFPGGDLSELIAGVEDACERRERLELALNDKTIKSDLGEVCVSNGLTPDRSTSHKLSMPISAGSSCIVGLEELMNKLVKQLAFDDHNQKGLKVVPILGLPGVGKTTAAGTLYQEHRGKFQCSAFVRVSRTPDMRSLLISILLQVKAPWLWAFPDAHDLIDGIKKHLEGKRYFIILDGLWTASVWDINQPCFP